MSNCSSLVHRPLPNIEKLGVAARPGDEAILCITVAHVLRKISQDLSGSNLHTRISGALTQLDALAITQAQLIKDS